MPARHKRVTASAAVGDGLARHRRAATGTALARSEAFWSLALAAGDGLAPAGRGQALRTLPRRLAFGFRGVLSFWTAGEIADGDLAASTRDVALAILLGVVNARRKTDLLGSPAWYSCLIRLSKEPGAIGQPPPRHCRNVRGKCRPWFESLGLLAAIGLATSLSLFGLQPDYTPKPVVGSAAARRIELAGCTLAAFRKPDADSGRLRTS